MLCFVILDFLALVTSSVSLHSADAVFYNNSRGGSGHGSCKLRSVREIGDEGFRGSMTQSFVLDDVEYKLCRYSVTWDEALVFCSTHEAHLATLDDEEKTLFVAQAIASSSSVTEDYWIGGRKYFGGVWTWDSNAKRLDSKTDIVNDIPIFYPDVGINDEVRCLTIDRAGHDKPIFVPRSCNQQRGFICQRDNDRSFNTKIRMVAASRVGEDEFRLYSGRATWAEAVVQCRQEGLQIAEVDTAEQARALAVSMLRNRPVGIESAWIGGYTRKNEPSRWRWLASGEIIKMNEMWQQNLTEASDGCLLLDRHLCEIPIYINSKCDRRRDVLCQKPPKKRLRKKPVEAIVDGCPYWIGFHPSKWSDAKRSCDSLNASLVVLDSPETISHMMRLMLDNGAELRHIWTDGRRTRDNGQWHWQVNDEIVPIYGESFIPWCPEDDNYPDELNCLNLDRENLDSPLVYGLSCEEKQSYVCQPRTGKCVLHSVSSPRIKTDEENYEKSIEAKFNTISLNKNSHNFQHSGVTGTMPLITDNRGIVSSSIVSSTPYSMDMKNDWKIDDILSPENATSGRKLSNYLNPLSRLTLPSFPQFGIKVASAYETTSTNPSINYENRKIAKIKQHSTKLTTTVTRSPYLESTTSLKSLKKIVFDNTKKMQNAGNKSNQSSISSSNNHNFVESSTKTTKSSKINEQRLTTKNTAKSKKIDHFSTTEGSLSLPIFQIDGKSTNEISKNFETTTRAIAKNVLENDGKIISSEEKKMAEKLTRPNTLRRISSLPKKLKKLGFTTSMPTPYDAIDEDYYDNYETEVTSQYNYETNMRFDDEYDNDENPETPRKTGETSSPKAEKKSSAGKSSRVENLKKAKNSKNNDEKLSIPMINELSKNLQNALINMLKKGAEDKSSKEEIVKPTTRSLGEKNIGFSRENMTESLTRMKNNSDLLTIRPYYAFEGPMVVALSDNSYEGRDSVKIDGNGQIHDFRMIVNDEKNSTSKKDKIESRRFGKNRSSDNVRNNNDNNNKNNNFFINGMSKVMADLPPIKPNDPNSLMQMGRFFKDRFGDMIGIDRNSDRVDPDGFRINLKNLREKKVDLPRRRDRTKNERIGNYDGNDDYGKKTGNRYDNNENLNVDGKSEFNYPEIGRRLYPRGNNEILFPSKPQEERTSDEKSWQERLRVSWPDERNATSLSIVRLDESEPEEYSLPALRTARSSDEDSTTLDMEDTKIATFPDFRMTNLIKEFKVEMEQRSLRKYLENFTKKLRKNEVDDRKEDWKDAWRYILIEMSKIFDRTNVNFNGEIMKIRLVSEEELKFDEIDKTRKDELKKKLRKRKKDFTNFLRNISKNAEPKINGNKSYAINGTDFIDNRRISSDVLRKEISDEVTTIKSMINNIRDDYSNESSMEKNSADRSNEKMMISEKPQTGSAPGDVEKRLMYLRKNFFQRYPTFSRPWTSDKTYLRPDNVETKLPNVYRTKYENFNNSHILAAPAIIGSVGEHKVYNFQPIMQQLHHRLAFNQGLDQFHPDRRINNITEKSRIFRGENLPKGILSKITSGEYRIYSDEITSKSIFLSKENYDSEEKNVDDENKRKNDHSINRDKERIDDKNNDDFESEDANEKIDSFDQDYSAVKILPPNFRLRKAIEFPQNLRKFRHNRGVYPWRTNRVAKSTTNDENLNKIMKNLELLTQEPSTVSLKITINSDENNRTTKSSRDSKDSSKNFENSRSIEIRLKFTGSQKKVDEKNYSSAFREREKKINKLRAINETRKISSRIDEKIRKREMLRKLRDMSRKIAARNYTLSWKKENGDTIIDFHDRKSRNSGINKNMKNSFDDSRQFLPSSEEKNSTILRNFRDEKIPVNRNDAIASLFTNISEKDDRLTLFINLTLGEFVTKLEESKQPET